MTNDLIERLTKEADQPSGIAPVIDAPELKRLMLERATALKACKVVDDFVRSMVKDEGVEAYAKALALLKEHEGAALGMRIRFALAMAAEP